MPGVKFKAAAVAVRAAKVPTCEIVAYNGGLMDVEGFGPIVVDLAGLTIPDTIPLVIDHDLAVSQTVGSGRAVVASGSLRITGTLTTIGEPSQRIIDLAKGGLPLQASIGATPEQEHQVREGETVFVNGRNITAGRGGFTLITRSTLVETSIVTKGADSSTSVSIAATAARKAAAAMTFEAYVQSLGLDPATLTPEATAALQTAYQAAQGGGGDVSATAAVRESERIRAIRAATTNNPQIGDRAVREGWDLARTEHAVQASHRPTGPSNNLTAPDVDQAKVIEASLLLGQGVSEKFVGRHFDQRTINAAMARENRGMGLHHVVNATLRTAGKSTGWQKVGQHQVSAAFDASNMIKAAGFSTVSLPGILGNASNKLLLAAYEAIPVTWRLFCGIQSAKDFKSYSGYRFTVTGELTEVGGSGELKHLTMQENEFSNQLTTRGGMITLSRKTIINDDLGAFASIPRNFGRLAAVGLEKAVYKKLLENVATIFTTGRGNYFTGSGTTLSIEQLGVAERMFLDQIDDAGDPLLITPSLLGVPTSLSATSAVVCRDTSIQHPADIDTAESTGNPHGGKFTPFVSPWLNNDNLAGSSDTHWFLFGTAPEQGVIHVGFLDGVQTPTIEEGDVEFSQLGMSWRVYFDFGVAIGDYRFGVRSKGAV